MLYATVETEVRIFMHCVSFESSTQNVVDKFEKAAGMHIGHSPRRTTQIPKIQA